MRMKVLFCAALLMVVGFFSSSQVCNETGTATGTDAAATSVAISSFPCTLGGVITDMSLTTSNTSSDCGSWYEYDIYVTHSGGTESLLSQCNVTSLDLATFDGATIDLSTITNITVEAYDLDFYADTVTINVDVEVTFIAPSCAPPLGINNTNVSSNVADFSWTDSSTEDAGYNWEVVPAGNGQGVGVVASGTTAANAVMVSATGLTSGTNYDFYIQSNCGGSTSSWSAPLSFSTQAGCGDTLSGLCYSQTSTIEVLASFSASSGDWAEIVFNSGGTEACCDELLVYDGLNGTGNLIYGALTGGGITDVSTIGSVVSTTGDISLAINSDGSVTCSSSTSVDPISITLNCVTPPSCIAPSSLSSSNTIDVSTELSWTSGGSGETEWEVEYGAPSFTPGTGAGTIVSANSNPFTLSGLSPQTDYDVYVRAVCSPTDSSAWSGVESFTTACAVFTIPFTEGFETTATGSSFSPNAPDCWSAIDSGSGSAYVYDNSLVNVQSGSKSFRLFNSFNTTGTYMLISPQIAELTTDGVTVAFSVKGANGQELEIGTISDPSDASTFSLSETITLSSSSFEDIEVIITTSTNSYVAIRHGQTGSSDDYYLDDFSFSAVPSCIPPSSLTVSNVSFDSAQLSWTANSGEAAWEVEYGAAGFTPGTGAGTIVAANSNPFTLTSLSSNTDYEVYVRAVCSPTDSSAWSGVASFATTLDYCGGNLLTDSGGENGDYGNSENIMYTICPDNPGDKVVITFIQFSFENNDSNCYDGLTIYDGDTTTGTIIPSPGGTTDEWCWDRDDATPSGSGDLLGMSIAATAASGCITIVLDSDFSATREGFVAQVSCESTVYMWDGAAWSNTPEGSITNNDNLYVMGAGAVLTATVATDNLIVGPGASLDVNNGAIDVAGDVFNNGTILGDDEVILGGTNVTLAGTGSIENLTVSASTTAVVNGDQSIIGTLDVESSGVLDAAGAITLVSNAMGTARVDAVDAGAIIGDVNVERYIPGTNRSFRFLGSSVTGPNVFDSWQEAGANAAGFGIQVTGVVGTVGTNNAATGLDETLTGNPSMFSWNDAGQSWDAIMNTTTEVLNAGDFYRVFVRGDRMTDLSTNNPGATATTLRATGSLLTGPYSVSPSVASGEFFAVANPYQSKLDMGLVAPANVATDMYYWDPSIGPKGDYTNINIATGTGTVGNATNVLDVGQAVFFSSTGSSSVNIEESDKVGGTTNAAVFSAPVVNQLLRVKLYQTSRYQNGQTESDGMYIHFDNTFSDAITSNDAIKWNGLNTNIAIDKATGEKLAVERRSLPAVNESVPLHISNHLATDYTMTVELDALPGLEVFVKDNLTNTLTPVASNGTTAVNFLVDANNAASIDPNRFEIVFQIVTLGLNDEDLLSQVRLYPNPVTGDELQLNLGNLNDGDALSVAIYNTLGQQVRVYNYESNISNTITVGNLDTLSGGVYILNITKGDKTAAYRFIKK